MHICRIRYTVLGLLIYYLQNAFSWSCDSDFDDVASKTVLSDVVFEGQAYREMQIKERPGYFNIRFNKIAFIKGNIFDASGKYSRNNDNDAVSQTKKEKSQRHGLHFHEKPFSLSISDSPGDTRYKFRRSGDIVVTSSKSPASSSQSVVVGQFGPLTDAPDCVFSKKSITRGQKYLVFIRFPEDKDQRRQSHDTSGEKPQKTSKDRSRHRATTPKPVEHPSSDVVYRMSGFPVQSSGSARREAMNHSCLSCGRKPRISKMTQSLNVTVGKRIKIVCKSTGFPKPEMFWLKNGLLMEPEGNVSINTKKQNSVLFIKDAKDEDSGQYQCYGLNALGQSNLSSTFVTVMSHTKKPFSELCEDQDYCVHGGTCYKLVTREHYFCQCTGDFIGDRCEEKNTGIVALLGRKKKRSLDLRRRHRV